ncbi:protein transporter Sec31 [Streptomyces sp. NPDC048416]|uniref:protein transporter Sec31 n=1 Tax=Streptomyces sp. NPDC048416 TaxID=3365546 RepID=UPI003713D53E
MANPHSSGASPRTREVIRTRTVPHTIDGKTRLVEETYTVAIPTPPRDWDLVARRAATGGAIVLVTASVIWSTASIGDLLTRVTIPAAAYAAAGVFDLAWIICMAVEWLARHDPQRAKLPRAAGYVALAIAMAAVGVHGWLGGLLWIGVIGAAVSGIAKGVWSVVLGTYSTQLDPRTQQWVDAERAEAAGRLALIPVRRELARANSLIAAEHAATETSDDEADDEPGILPMRPSARQAVQTAVASGVTDADQVLAYVQKVADAKAKPDTIERYLRGLGVHRSA